MDRDIRMREESQNLRRLYEDRLTHITDCLTGISGTIQNDHLLGQLKEDGTSQKIITSRIHELIEHSVWLEKEGIINELMERIACLEVERTSHLREIELLQASKIDIERRDIGGHRLDLGISDTSTRSILVSELTPLRLGLENLVNEAKKSIQFGKNWEEEKRLKEEEILKITKEKDQLFSENIALKTERSRLEKNMDEEREKNQVQLAETLERQNESFLSSKLTSLKTIRPYEEEIDRLRLRVRELEIQNKININSPYPKSSYTPLTNKISTSNILRTPLRGELFSP